MDSGRQPDFVSEWWPLTGRDALLPSKNEGAILVYWQRPGKLGLGHTACLIKYEWSWVDGQLVDKDMKPIPIPYGSIWTRCPEIKPKESEWNYRDYLSTS